MFVVIHPTSQWSNQIPLSALVRLLNLLKTERRHDAEVRSSQNAVLDGLGRLISL